MISDNPKISIIVPIYNAEKHLEKCLISISNQTFESFEVLLIDDGSTDNSKKIAKNFEKNDFRFQYYHKKNNGVSAARNLGLNLSKGKYIVFIDADDFCNPQFIENLFNGIEKEYDFVASGYTHVDMLNNFYEVKTPKVSGEVTQSICIQEIIRDQSICTFPWNKIYHKRIIDKFNIQFDESIFYGEDFLFLISYISNCQSFLIINSSDYNYIKHYGSITTDSSSKGLTRRLSYLVAMEKVQNILSINSLEEIKDIKVKYNDFGLTLYRLMKKSKLPKSKIKEINKKLKKNYQMIKYDIDIRGKIKYYLCIYFPGITNFFVKILRNEENLE